MTSTRQNHPRLARTPARRLIGSLAAAAVVASGLTIAPVVSPTIATAIGVSAHAEDPATSYEVAVTSVTPIASDGGATGAIVVQGTAWPGSTVSLTADPLYESAVRMTATSSPLTGRWLAVFRGLYPQEYQIKDVTAFDASGNSATAEEQWTTVATESAPADPLTYILTTGAVPTPAGYQSDGGELRVYGVTEPGAPVAVTLTGPSPSSKPATFSDQGGWVVVFEGLKPGAYSINATATDQASNSSHDITTVTVAEAPELATTDDEVTIKGGETATFDDVTANDTYIGDVTFAWSGADADKGDWSYDPAGAVEITPNIGYTGTAGARYEISDSFDQWTYGFVRVTVVAPDIEAVDDTASTEYGEPVTVDVLENDKVVGLTALLIESVPPDQGRWDVTSDNKIRFTPVEGFSGTAEMPYTITDSYHQTGDGTVTVTVGARPAPKPPTVNPNTLDPDHDGLTTGREKKLGTNPRVADTDRDGLKDGREVKHFKTNPLRADTDRDGLNDRREVKGWTAWRYAKKTGTKTIRWHVTSNPRKADTDHDGMRDRREYRLRLDPRDRNTDGPNTTYRPDSRDSRPHRPNSGTRR